MGQIDFSLKKEFNWEKYCSTFTSSTQGWDDLHDSSRQFMERLGLSSIHPHCVSGDFVTDAPLMGPLVEHDYHDTVVDFIITAWKQGSPALLAMSELWLRLFSAILAPMGIAYLVLALLGPVPDNNSKYPKQAKQTRFRVTVASIVSLASSVVLTTDMWYIYEYGSSFGLSMLSTSFMLTLICAIRHRLPLLVVVLLMMLSLTVHLSYDFEVGTLTFGGTNLPHSIEEGLYYNTENPLVARLTQHWPLKARTYSPKTGATPWTPTGDSRTGIPFLVNFWEDNLTFTKVWVPTIDDEAVRLEISFPKSGHDTRKPIYIILHGLSGGSQEEYIKDVTNRVNADGSTVCIMIARGLMDTPIKGWNVFHGARVSDIDSTAKAIRKARSDGQSLVGAGYSMGAIILANYVARSGPDCSLDAAISVSGTLDSRPQFYNERAKRLWQPMLAITLREQFIIGKVAERYRKRLTRRQMLELMRATHISAVDVHGVVTYNGFDDVMHYYSEMSAMGDISLVDDPKDHGRIANVSIPFCVLHALDDPLISWKTVASNQGLRHPTNIVKTGSGNLMMLLTKRGGHVGWPLGVNPVVDKWGWMSGAVRSFVDAFEKAKNEV